MKTIAIKAYRDIAGISGGTWLPESDPLKLTEIMHKAKRQFELPEGFKRLELFTSEVPDEVAVAMPEDVREYASKSHAHTQRELADQRKSEKERQELNSYVTAANRIFRDARDRRNESVAAVAAQRNLLSSDRISDKDKSGIQKKIEDLQEKSESAIAGFQNVLTNFNVLKNPKSSLEQIEAALIGLKIKQPIPA